MSDSEIRDRNGEVNDLKQKLVHWRIAFGVLLLAVIYIVPTLHGDISDLESELCSVAPTDEHC